MAKFVFVLAPPYSGSTVLTRLLETSANVSNLPTEGQFVPAVRDVMRFEPWTADQSLPWDAIREVWEGHWDEAKPLWLEKSPPNIIRSEEISEHFDPAYFIAMVREPYAHIEGLARRSNVPPMDLSKSASRTDCIAHAVACWIMFASHQRDTIRNRKHVTWFTYETLTTEPLLVASQLKTFLPELGSLDTEATFGVHAVSGTTARSLTDLNEPKRRLLTTSDFELISALLAPEMELLAFFGYDLRAPAPDQDRVAKKEATRNTFSRAANNLRKLFKGSGKRR